MGDGWETRRRRDKGFDWLILNSIKGKKIDKIEISTHHFKGNYPSHCSLQAAYIPNKKSSSNIVKDETITGVDVNNTAITANALSYNSTLGLLKVSNPSGQFAEGSTITFGSGATATVERMELSTATTSVSSIVDTTGNFVNQDGFISENTMRIQDLSLIHI